MVYANYNIIDTACQLCESTLSIGYAPAYLKRIASVPSCWAHGMATTIASHNATGTALSALAVQCCVAALSSCQRVNNPSPDCTSSPKLAAWSCYSARGRPQRPSSEDTHASSRHSKQQWCQVWNGR
eukprot:6180222-Pleurochrysis_carterae.AAC.1